MDQPSTMAVPVVVRGSPVPRSRISGEDQVLWHHGFLKSSGIFGEVAHYVLLLCMWNYPDEILVGSLHPVIGRSRTGVSKAIKALRDARWVVSPHRGSIRLADRPPVEIPGLNYEPAEVRK